MIARQRLIIKPLIRRHENRRGSALIPLSVNLIKIAILIENPFRNSKIYRTYVIVMIRARTRYTCQITCLINFYIQRFKFGSVTNKRGRCRSVLSIRCHISAALICMSDIFIQRNFVFCSFKKNTGNVVSTTTMLSFIFRRGFQQLAFRIHYFELIEKIVVIPGCA